MAFEGTISDLMREDTIDANKILDNLLDPKNIDMKTDIQDPITFAILESLVIDLEKLLKSEKIVKLPITKGLLKNVVKKLKMFLVSWERKSRVEITETLKAQREESQAKQSIFQRLTGMGT